ncbi:MAG: N-acetylmuramoyl-L-alanine amidase [Bacteroidota bacterium]
MLKFRYCISILIITGFVMISPAQTPNFSGYKVMINPGHGGHDSDDRGQPNGFWESEGNLTKGLWLRDLLEARGCEVIMSRVLNRTEDDLPLSQIAAIANENNVDLFLSIHSNAGNQYSNYPMTIFNGKSESPSNPEAKVWAITLWEQLITNQATYWTDTAPHYIGDLTLRPDWNYGYGVLYPLQVPGIISEGSFHDYQPEVDRLLNLDYRKQEAWNMLYAMITYFQLDGTEPLGNISGIIRDSLLTKENYTILGSPDKYHNVNGALAELLETGESYQVDEVNTGFYMFDSIPPGNYHLVFSAPDYFNDTVAVEVVAHKFSYINRWMEADKTMAPKLMGHTPIDSSLIPCFDPVTFTFNMNMDSASVAEAFTIDPPVDGTFSWDKYYLTATFQPNLPYDTGTVYTVMLDSIAEHQWGVNMDTIHSFSFITDHRNRYLLEASFPDSGQELVSPYLQFRLIFDAPLKNSSLINAVSIMAEDGTILTTKGASILTLEEKGHYYFSPEMDLQFNTGYTLTLAGSIKDEGNIPMVDTQRISFRTMTEPGVITILEEFDDVEEWSLDLVNSQGIDNSSFLYRWTKTYLSGYASMLLRYQFLNNDAFCMIKPVEPIDLNERLQEAGMWIWGDLSHNQIILGFNNGTEALLGEVNYAGWGYNLTEVPEGADSLVYIKLIRTDGAVETGDLYFDLFHQPGSTVSVPPFKEDDITLYPNPVNGSTIHIDGIPEGSFGYSMYSVTGTLIQEGKLMQGENSIELRKNALNQQLIILNISTETGTYSELIINVN